MEIKPPSEGDVGELSRLRHEVAELREQLRISELTLSHIPDFAYLFDLNGRFTYVNGALLRLWRLPLREAVGKNFFDLGYPAELAARLQTQITEVIKRRQALKDSTPFTDPAGETRQYEYIFVPVMGEGGVKAVAGSTRDITDLKLAESQRSRSEALLQMVIDNVPGLVSYLDSNFCYQIANRRYAEWFQGSPPAGGRVADLVGEEAFRRTRPYMERAMAGELVCFDDYLPYTGTKGRHVHVTYTPDREGDNAVRGVVAMVQDITEQKEMEEALRNSEERLQQVFSQAPVGVAVLRGRKMIFELVNPSYQRFFPGRELLNRPLREAIPEVNDELASILNRVLETGDPFVAREYQIQVDRDRDGVAEDLYFTFVYQPLREKDISVSGIVVIAVDVTTHVRARQEQERVNRQLEEFAYIASHDLQEPLRMVNIYSQLLLKQPASSQEKLDQYAGFVREGVKRMQLLISDMLTYSQTVHRQDVPSGHADLDAAWTEAMSVLKDRILENQARITTGSLPMVCGDTSQIAHIFQNLLSNSLKYRRKDCYPEIQIAAERDGPYWMISVRDNGIGFDQQYAKQIFGLFKRLHKGEYPGTGLGLAICQRIVERYDGRMWAESSPGAGSTFLFTLKAVNPEALAES